MLNSLYGGISNRYFRWYNLDNAKAITLSGQIMIKYIAKCLNQFVNDKMNTDDDWVVGIDTDSNYLNLGPLFKKLNLHTVDEMDTYIKTEMEPFIDESYQKMFNYLNNFENQMVMKREVIAERGLFLNTKKRYALAVVDDEGLRLSKPKFKIMGLEVIKTQTPTKVRELLSQVIPTILYKDNESLITLIDECKEKMKSFPIEDLGINKSVSYIHKYMNDIGGYKKGCPINSRAAIVFNRELQMKNIDKKYEPIKEKDKMKYIFLHSNNPTNSNVIGYSSVFPDELELKEYFDFETQFNKVFLDPIKAIITHINWKFEILYTIDDLF